MSSLKSRLLVSAVGVPLLLWVVLAAPTIVMTIALAVLSAIGADELMKCVGARPYVRSCAVGFAALSVMWNETPFTNQIAILWVIYVVGIFVYAIIKAGEVKFQEIAASICAVILIPYSFSAFLRLEAAGFHRAYLLLPFILSFACDTFAYIVGCSIGKHKLAPKVSPKKSVEGSVGGLLGNVLCGCIFGFVMNRWFGGTISYGGMVILALVCGVVAQVGDLSFSLIKREFGIKDYGKLFLAHGGVLDRFDSVLFVTPVIEIILGFMK